MAPHSSTRRSARTRRFLPALTVAAAAAVVTTIALSAGPALGHGYVGGGGTILARAADSANTGRGAIAYEPQSLEAPKGFPAAGPADGKLASAGLAIAAALDEQTATRWHKHTVTTGALVIPWHFTAPHRTSQWRYFLTVPGWDPNAPLDRGDFELIATIAHDGSAASTNPTHTITIPADRSGYHVLYAVWDIADTTNAFYNVIDLDIVGSTPQPTPTSTASPTPTSSPTPTASATPPSPSPTSTPTSTPAPSATPTPTPTIPAAPHHLHTMSVTADAVSLMWFAGPDAAAFTVTRDDVPLTTTTSTTFVDTAPVPGASHTYRVRSRGATGLESSNAASLTVTIPGATSPTAEPWSATGRYRIGDVVTYGGATFRCIQSYQGWGDPNWILAPSLWERV